MLALPNAIGVESSRVALQEKIHHIQLNLVSKSPSWCLESQVINNKRDGISRSPFSVWRLPGIQQI